MFARNVSLLLLLLGLTAGLAGWAGAQVPQDVSFRGRLVDSVGSPLTGPVAIQLRVFDAETGGTVLYSESHPSVPLDSTGGFSVQLGLGTPLSGTFDAALFAGVDRWLEVIVGAQLLPPRRIIASVPTVVVAQQANRIVPDPDAPFEDCGDGTVADPQTGLLWEKKTGTVGTAVGCETAGCPDPHVVNNFYTWSSTGTLPDGGAFTDFLVKLNDPYGSAATGSEVTGCLAAHCDWRLPTIVELQSILDCGFGPPCIDPIFGPAAEFYFSASTNAGDAARAWYVTLDEGDVRALGIKVNAAGARAVRAGSCH